MTTIEKIMIYYTFILSLFMFVIPYMPNDVGYRRKLEWKREL